jgi:hypothetical protein
LPAAKSIVPQILQMTQIFASPAVKRDSQGYFDRLSTQIYTNFVSPAVKKGLPQMAQIYTERNLPSAKKGVCHRYFDRLITEQQKRRNVPNKKEATLSCLFFY